MAEQSSESITVAAPRATVMAVIADFGSYPVWAKSVKLCEVLSSGPNGRAERVHFVVENGPIKDDYELHYEWTGEDSVTWSLVRGQMQKAQHGSYTLAEAGADSTTVTYRLTVEPAMPMLGMLKRKVEKVILNTALNELKKYVESGAGSAST